MTQEVHPTSERKQNEYLALRRRYEISLNG